MRILNYQRRREDARTQADGLYALRILLRNGIRVFTDFAHSAFWSAMLPRIAFVTASLRDSLPRRGCAIQLGNDFRPRGAQHRFRNDERTRLSHRGYTRAIWQGYAVCRRSQWRRLEV